MIVYTDETWVNAGHTSGYQWHTPNSEYDRRLPTNKGERLIVLHAGCAEKGFLPSCALVFKAKSKDGRDYHTEMNGQVFLEWVEQQLIPNLPQRSCLVMDNAMYHNIQTEGSKCPNSNSKKQEMQDYLTRHNISFDAKLTKPKLYEIIKLNKKDPMYKADDLISKAGHCTLRLPPYHCNLNPIELVWGDIKQHIGIENSTFKLTDVQNMVHAEFDRITPEKWAKCVQHVIEKEEKRYWEKDAMQPDIEPVIISLDSSDDDSDDE